MRLFFVFLCAEKAQKRRLSELARKLRSSDPTVEIFRPGCHLVNEECVKAANLTRKTAQYVDTTALLVGRDSIEWFLIVDLNKRTNCVFFFSRQTQRGAGRRAVGRGFKPVPIASLILFPICAFAPGANLGTSASRILFVKFLIDKTAYLSERDFLVRVYVIQRLLLTTLL